MKRKGINFRRANHLGFRDPKRGDTYADGKPIPKHYVVIVSIKNCKLKKERGRLIYDPSEAPALPNLSSHSRTNMVYGTINRSKNKNYNTKPVYLVEDAIVYQGTKHVEMDRENQPKNGWYDRHGRLYIKYAHNMPLDTATAIMGKINAEYDQRQYAIIRASESRYCWDLYIHNSIANDYN